MWYWILRIAATIVFNLFFGLKVEGRENIPEKGNFIVVANHASFLDPVLLSVAIPRQIYWITAKSVYDVWWLKWIMIGAASIPTGSSTTKAISLLKEHKNIGIFPEGIRTQDGKLKEFRKGAALLALKTNRTVLPCAVFGTYEALPRHARFPRFMPLKVKIGKPKFILSKFEHEIDDMDIQKGAFTIRNAVKELLDNG